MTPDERLIEDIADIIAGPDASPKERKIALRLAKDVVADEPLEVAIEMRGAAERYIQATSGVGLLEELNQEKGELH